MSRLSFIAKIPLFVFPLCAAHAASVASDQKFHPPPFASPDFDSRVLLLSDGGFLECFEPQMLLDQPRSGTLIRFFANGSFDSSFAFTRDFFYVSAAAALPDSRALPPGAYTAIVRGKGDATGVALVEVYALH